MKLSLRQLQVFLAVADYGTTIQAADAIALSQSATSAALNELENMLGMPLFDRIGKRLQLNDAGRLLIPQARLMLDTAEDIQQQFLQTPLSLANLCIGASSTIGIYCLPHLLAARSKRLKQLGQGRIPSLSDNMQPRVVIGNTSEIIDAVAAYEVDFGFIEGPCHHDLLKVEAWLEDELVIVAGPDYPLQRQADGRVAAAELSRQSWLLRERGSGTREMVEQSLLPALHHLKLAAELGHSEAIKHAAAAGLGLACLSRMVVADWIASGRLLELPTSLPPMLRHFYLIYHQHKTLSPQIQAFMAFCRSWDWRAPASD